MARSFRSASSRCASVDFTASAAAAFVAFPFPGFGGMAEAVGEIDGAGGGSSDGGGALPSFNSASGGGRRGSCVLKFIGSTKAGGAGSRRLGELVEAVLLRVGRVEEVVHPLEAILQLLACAARIFFMGVS